MTLMFYKASKFAPKALNWNTGQVSYMNRMFEHATKFNADITSWDTSQLIDMSSMFMEAGTFNSDITNWDTSRVLDMTLMFYKAAAFNSDLSKWQTSNVAKMNKMFFQAAAFNSDLSKWNTEGTELSLMFFGATVFDRTLCGDQWTAPGKVNANNDVLRDSNGRYGCCEVGSFMSNPYGPFNSTDGGGSCLACPTGWKSMNAILNVNYNCTRCEDGKSSISKTTSCTSCARGRILVTVEPLYWYVILLNVCPFSFFCFCFCKALC